MHLTLKKEATRPAALNFLQQQARFDDFIDCYNYQRPPQALAMKYPAELYRPSPRSYHGDYDLGFFDHETGRLASIQNPFAAKVLPMSPE